MPKNPQELFFDNVAPHIWQMSFILSDAFKGFIELIPDAVIFSNVDGNVILTNTRARDLFQYSLKEIDSITIEDLVPNKIKNNHIRMREIFFKNPYPRFLSSRKFELKAKKKDNSIFPMDAALFALQTNEGPLAVNMIRDITDQEENRKQLSEYAFVDALTQLPNRRYFSENLKKYFAKAQRHNEKLALLFIDLDKFKPINDNFGHETGDFVLQKISSRLSVALRCDDFLSRIGGDEFVLILYPVNDRAGVCKVARKIISECSRSVEFGEQQFIVGASIGISIYNDDQNAIVNSDELLKQADQAMYAAKTKGGNYFIIYDEIER